MRRYLALLLVLSLPAFGAEPPKPPDAKDVELQAHLDEICAKTACRPLKTITLRLHEAGSTSQVEVPRSPYVSEEGGIIVWPGEFLIFHIGTNGDVLQPPVFAREESSQIGDATQIKDGQPGKGFDESNRPELRQVLADQRANGPMKDRIKKEPPGTLYVYFRQIPDGEGMILETAHNLAQPLKFDATIARPTPTSFHFEHSSTCVVRPDLGGVETWPYVLGPLVLENLRLQPAQTCD